MVLITHDMGVEATHCDYVGVVYAGNIVEYGTKSRYLTIRPIPIRSDCLGLSPIWNEDEEWLHPD